MNSSEFKERLGAEPRRVAAEVRAGETDPERLQATAEAEAFEDRLEGALRAPVNEAALLDEVLAIPNRIQRRGPPAWLAVAASLVLVVGVAGVAWWQSRPAPPLAEYVRSHFDHDGADVLARAASAVDPAEVEAVLASLGTAASPELVKRVQYIKFCPTPDSRGAHMVLSTESGPATVIFMPAVTVEQPLLLRLDGMEARVVGLSAGAAAIIAGDGTVNEALQTSLQAGLKPLGADT